MTTHEHIILSDVTASLAATHLTPAIPAATPPVSFLGAFDSGDLPASDPYLQLYDTGRFTLPDFTDPFVSFVVLGASADATPSWFDDLADLAHFPSSGISISSTSYSPDDQTRLVSSFRPDAPNLTSGFFRILISTEEAVRLFGVVLAVPKDAFYLSSVPGIYGGELIESGVQTKSRNFDSFEDFGSGYHGSQETGARMMVPYFGSGPGATISGDGEIFGYDSDVGSLWLQVAPGEITGRRRVNEDTRSFAIREVSATVTTPNPLSVHGSAKGALSTPSVSSYYEGSYDFQRHDGRKISSPVIIGNSTVDVHDVNEKETIHLESNDRALALAPVYRRDLAANFEYGFRDFYELNAGDHWEAPVKLNNGIVVVAMARDDPTDLTIPGTPTLSQSGVTGWDILYDLAVPIAVYEPFSAYNNVGSYSSGRVTIFRAQRRLRGVDDILSVYPAETGTSQSWMGWTTPYSAYHDSQGALFTGPADLDETVDADWTFEDLGYGGDWLSTYQAAPVTASANARIVVTLGTQYELNATLPIFSNAFGFSRNLFNLQLCSIIGNRIEQEFGLFTSRFSDTTFFGPGIGLDPLVDGFPKAYRISFEIFAHPAITRAYELL